MKYIKKFEDINEPEVGDYVICSEEHDGLSKKLIDFTSNNIGQLIEIDGTQYYPFVVKYDDNVPLELEVNFLHNTRGMMRAEIIHYSKNKEDLEMILNANKYNL